jgi:hypothetical protein
MLLTVVDFATVRPPMRAAALFVLVSAAGLAADPVPTIRPAATSTSEAGRLGAEYFVQKSGASWVYQLGDGKTRGHVTITAIVDWRAQFTFSFGKRSGGGHWRALNGVWLERSAARGDVEAVLLPATMTRGTRWTGPSSIERAGTTSSQFEVMALEATVELPTGMTVEHCLAVLETAADGTEPWTHYYAPNVGKVAVLGPAGWFSRLLEFRSGARHAE